ncbi:hypothetical protein ONZ51_g12435 [Trametes cubensis]|uniref:Uncharacterized protein n=1 Tax=Trametes cubensis TaxID=1111947 RepID=A0AAD7X5F2_9APHY|nr:hypothetical protein ONZ51_g12435 [Trametes cubensis]
MAAFNLVAEPPLEQSFIDPTPGEALDPLLASSSDRRLPKGEIRQADFNSLVQYLIATPRRDPRILIVAGRLEECFTAANPSDRDTVSTQWTLSRQLLYPLVLWARHRSTWSEAVAFWSNIAVQTGESAAGLVARIEWSKRFETLRDAPALESSALSGDPSCFPDYTVRPAFVPPFIEAVHSGAPRIKPEPDAIQIPPSLLGNPIDMTADVSSDSDEEAGATPRNRLRNKTASTLKTSGAVFRFDGPCGFCQDGQRQCSFSNDTALVCEPCAHGHQTCKWGSRAKTGPGVNTRGELKAGHAVCGFYDGAAIILFPDAAPEVVTMAQDVLAVLPAARELGPDALRALRSRLPTDAHTSTRPDRLSIPPLACAFRLSF